MDRSKKNDSEFVNMILLKIFKPSELILHSVTGKGTDKEGLEKTKLEIAKGK
jgi:hypothetical protein